MFRGSIILTIFCCLLAVSMEAVPARVMKVLPQFLDTNGVHTLSPSLYERDAYQAYLREHPDKRSGIRFEVHWRKGPGEAYLYQPVVLQSTGGRVMFVRSEGSVV